jgi:hypothetical protein
MNCGLLICDNDCHMMYPVNYDMCRAYCVPKCAGEGVFHCRAVQVLHSPNLFQSYPCKRPTGILLRHPTTSKRPFLCEHMTLPHKGGPHFPNKPCRRSPFSPHAVPHPFRYLPFGFKNKYLRYCISPLASRISQRKPRACIRCMIFKGYPQKGVGIK